MTVGSLKAPTTDKFTLHSHSIVCNFPQAVFYSLLVVFSFVFLVSEVFCDSQRNILKENDIVKFPKLADTYQRIADEGPDVFYNGSMAQSIVEDIQAAGRVLFFFTDRIKSLTTATFEHFPLVLNSL